MNNRTDDFLYHSFRFFSQDDLLLPVDFSFHNGMQNIVHFWLAHYVTKMLKLSLFIVILSSLSLHILMRTPVFLTKCISFYCKIYIQVTSPDTTNRRSARDILYKLTIPETFFSKPLDLNSQIMSKNTSNYKNNQHSNVETLRATLL